MWMISCRDESVAAALEAVASAATVAAEFAEPFAGGRVEWYATNGKATGGEAQSAGDPEERMVGEQMSAVVAVNLADLDIDPASRPGYIANSIKVRQSIDVSRRLSGRDTLE